MWQFVPSAAFRAWAPAPSSRLRSPLADLYTPAERGKYAGYFGAVFGLSSILGPAVGGIITDTWGWHWIFLINVPIGLISFFMIYRAAADLPLADATTDIDYVGRCPVHGDDRAVHGRPEQQAEPGARVDRSVGRWLDARRR